MRVGDILRPNFLDLVRDQVAEANRALKALEALLAGPKAKLLEVNKKAFQLGRAAAMKK